MVEEYAYGVPSNILLALAFGAGPYAGRLRQSVTQESASDVCRAARFFR